MSFNGSNTVNTNLTEGSGLCVYMVTTLHNSYFTSPEINMSWETKLKLKKARNYWQEKNMWDKWTENWSSEGQT
jgi:hypothetical protein